jgi:very-short-patch-repair endonuclease
MSNFVNTGDKVFRNPLTSGDGIVVLDAALALRPQESEHINGAPVDDTSKEYVMTTRKTLALPDPSEQPAEAPALKKKGRGWEISDSRLDALHERAREMRRFSTEAHKALAARFAKADFGRYKFTRHAVVGSAIVDFNCHNLGMAIVIDEPDQDEKLAHRRDKSLESVGIRVMRIKAADILENIDTVLPRIAAGMRLRIADKGSARREHQRNSAPKARPERQ